MAGETPDRSKQRKSSGRDSRKPSSGEAASSASDPRLSVRGDRPAPPPAGSAPVPDQPTAVFRVPREGAEPAPERADAPSGGEDAPGAPPEGAAEAPEGPAAASEGPEVTPNASDPASAPDEAPVASPPDAAAPVVPADAETAETDPVRAAGNAPTAELPSVDDDAADDADAKPPVAPDEPAAEPAPDAPAASKDARLRDAVAAWVATEGTDGAPAADPDTAPEDDSAASPATAGTGGTDGEDRSGDASAAASPAEDPAAGENVASAAGDDSDERPAREQAPAGTGGTDDADQPAASATGPEDAPADASPAADGPDGGSAAREQASGASDDDGRPEDSAAEPEDAPSDQGARDRAAGPSGGGDGDSDVAAGDDADADAAVQRDEEAGAGVDQPTGVFRVGAARKEPDQPTAVFRAVKPGKAGGAPPESDGERTSTFVPLRGPDEARKPKPEPERAAQGGAAGAASAAAAPAARKPAAPQKPAPQKPAAGEPAAAPAEQTRTQPVPPRPPLDLLAELTNTPPPPETPVRTAVRRVKVWTPLVLLLLIVFAVVQAFRPLPTPELALTSDATYTFEGDDLRLPWPGQGQSAVAVEGVGPLGSEGAQQPKAIASVAKVMTAYVILKEHPLKGDETGPTIEVDAQAEKESSQVDESTAKLERGRKYSEAQMLQLLLIPSGNNVARLLARWDAGDTKSFVAKMNAAADDLGMKNTTYTDPSGLEKETVSTAEDQLKLAAAVMKYDVFRQIVDMPETTVEGIDGKIYNNNTLLLRNGVSGIKTGSSTPAGGNLMWSAETVVDGKQRRILGVVMNQQAGSGVVYESLQLSLDNSYKLIQAAQEGVTSATVVKKGTVVGHVDDGLGGRTPVVATKDLKAVGWGGLDVDLRLTDGGDTVPHSAKAGDVVGSLTVGTGAGQVSAPVALKSELTEPGFGDKLTRLG